VEEGEEGMMIYEGGPCPPIFPVKVERIRVSVTFTPFSQIPRKFQCIDIIKRPTTKRPSMYDDDDALR